MDEGKLLRHIISKDGIRIDPARVEAIQQIEQSRNKKEIQSFNGKLNFLRHFIPNLAEHLREITSMPKKDSQREGVEKPIAFYSCIIRDGALKYNIIEKQALALVKALQYFRVYILHSHILAYVPNAAVKDILVQADREGRRGKWIVALLEYDVEIKPTKLIKGQGLAKLIAETNLQILDINLIVAMSDEDQENSSIQKLQPLPLKPIEVSAPFQQWGLDFIGEIHLTSSGQHRWILTATDYFTKWIEAIPIRQATNAVIISFLETNILSRFGCPSKLIMDNVAAFKSKRMIAFCYKYNISLGHSTAYHPQGNGLAESSNKSLVNIIKKLLEISKKGWHKKLINALWADRVSQKKSIGMSPFELVYGTDTVFPTSLAVPVVKLLQEAGSEEDPMQRRINQMIHLQQTREEVFQNTFKLQECIKKIYDQKAKADTFQLDEVVLRWDARHEDKGKHGKFENLWKGPYKIAAYRGQNAFLLKEMNGDECPGGPINGRLLKRYYF
eukprot:PITA_24019